MEGVEKDASSSLSKRVYGIFSEFMARIGTLEEMGSVGSNLLDGFCQPLESLRRQPIQKISEVAFGIIEVNKTERMKAYLDAGCCNVHDVIQNMKKSKDLINKLEGLMEDVIVIVRVTDESLLLYWDKDSDDESSARTIKSTKGESESVHLLKPEVSDYVGMMGILYSMFKKDYAMQVIDGEGGNDYRRDLLPSYKAHRRKLSKEWSTSQRFTRSTGGNSHHIITEFFQNCNVPVLKVEGHEADDVVATLAEQVLRQGLRVVIGSPDKDFKQLISEDVQIVMPMPEFGRWSFYTLKHYIAQYNCDPSSDLSFRCIVGDEVDGVPGIQHVVPGFGRKTALKLVKKHGSLENLLSAAAVRTVGKQYVQDALSKHGDYLRKNYQVLSLRRDVDVHLKEEWLSERDTRNDMSVLSNFVELLGQSQKLYDQTHIQYCST
ncbi:hypothetical protein GIB67_026289 [Kingdonia uniflora]|uniref:5'-3' exonuclease domain-containing protein n=1 Tax=Kingdonia uniflora TaxID=39325 RepID=A0A7J7L9X4_9MAGN|nr:hypothetical protein GIB67_026289 [Kingdonia uniflora]